MTLVTKAALAAGALALAGCVSMPSGPNVMVLPGTGKSFEQFRADDLDCRQFANAQVGNTPDGAAENSGVKSAAVGTLVGAAAGAIIGGRGSVAAGAGTGLIVGSVAGAGAAGSSSYALQRRYDQSFTQCMYAKGHKVPSAGRFETQRPVVYSAPPVQYGSPPAPPSGTPPAPATRGAIKKGRAQRPFSCLQPPAPYISHSR